MNEARRTKNSGFTIIELLIATVVFSLILLLIAEGVIQFNRAYYRGLTQTNTQNVARAILDNVSQTIQFTNGAVTTGLSGAPTYSTWSGLCVGNQLFQYQLGKELIPDNPTAPNQVSQAIYKNNTGDCSGAVPGQTVAGSELLSPHMRLSDLRVTPQGSNDLYKVDIRVVYGDDDLLCAQSVSGSCDSPTSINGATAKDAQCKSFDGNQFCAEVDLSTIVQKRID